MKIRINTLLLCASAGMSFATITALTIIALDQGRVLVPKPFVIMGIIGWPTFFTTLAIELRHKLRMRRLPRPHVRELTEEEKRQHFGSGFGFAPPPKTAIFHCEPHNADLCFNHRENCSGKQESDCEIKALSSNFNRQCEVC